MSHSDKQVPFDRAAFADDLQNRWSFYALSRFFSDQERDEILAALRPPPLKALPSATVERDLLERSLPLLRGHVHGGEMVKRIEAHLSHAGTPQPPASEAAICVDLTGGPDRTVYSDSKGNIAERLYDPREDKSPPTQARLPWIVQMMWDLGMYTQAREVQRLGDSYYALHASSVPGGAGVAKITEDRIDAALQAALDLADRVGGHCLDVRPPWHDNDRRMVRAMLAAYPAAPEVK